MTLAQKNLFKDSLHIFVSIAFAYVIVRTGVVHATLATAEQYAILGSIAAGICFASVFTIAPATVIFAELGQNNSPFLIAFFGGLGAVVGDLIIFRFMRNRVALHISYLMNRSKTKFLRRMLTRRWSKILLPVIGAIIIASPFPDELGLAFMGLSHIKLAAFIPLAFVLNFLGILAIAFVARASGI